MKSYLFIILIPVSFLLFSQCENALDKQDLGSVNEADVWRDAKLATAYVNKIYADNLPTWDAQLASYSDESPGGGDILYGQLTVNSIDHWPYPQIRNINILLENIEGGTLDQNTKDLLKGQAYFFRALRYFEMVRLYGGVPLILKPQQLTEDLLVERASTSACIASIIADLDEAAQLLPDTWSGNDIGRLTKGAALALKGRVLLYWASPQFNPNGESTRWQTALEANETALEYLITNGYGLYEDFENIWFDEMNKEVIFVNRYQEPGRVHNWDAATRPLSEAQNATGANQPTLELVTSFPMKDGIPVSQSSDYNPQKYWLNRDPRFYSTIAYNGVLWELSGKSGRKQWHYTGAESQYPTQTGFYCRKAINTSYTPYFTERSSTDWIEIRFAEVMLNYAEAAAETGNTDEAYQMLKEIRNRAGIDPGANELYGLTAQMDKNQMLDAITLERKIEFAFEGKRYWDLRRRRLFDEELNGKTRTGILIQLNIPDEQFLQIRDNINIDEDYGTYMRDSVVVLDRVFPINFRENYYFYAIPQSHLQLNSNLKQTNGWDDGTFNPLD
ncbi:RagB/SusD family nutrient uptake outer membrane protein [Parapedobacter defluvii]|uniref:RagB/SusD family nutrient uptake outer membrane protein n=1 Tax=Parapedobacter defluvii TaxID=2045106 RepID=UPI00333ED236